MANIDFETIGKNAKADKLDEAQAISRAKIANSGKDLSLSEMNSFTKGYIGKGLKDTTGNSATGAAKSIGGGLLDLAKDSNAPGAPEFVGLDSYAKGITGIIKAVKTGDGVSGIWNVIKGVANQGIEFLNEEKNIRNKINAEMGVTGKLGNDVRDSIMLSAPAAYKLGFGVSQVTEEFTKLNETSGRFNFMSKEIAEESFKTAKMMNISLADMGTTYGNFERIGMGFKDTTVSLNEAFTKSLRMGLSGTQTTKDVRENLGKLNEYGFKNGVQGLAEMSRIAKIFRADMSDAFTLADKVMDPEGAIGLTANLQALGGAIGEFNDPFKLMYDATNNVEGLQKAIIGAAKDLATYNKEQGRFEVTGANIRRAQEMYKITGISVKELTTIAIAGQEKVLGLQQLAMSSMTNIKKEDKDFLLNLAHMEHGEMVISIPDSLRDKFGKIAEDGTIPIRKLTNETKLQLERYQDEFKKMNPEDIARGQFTALQNISHDVASITAYVRSQMVRSGGAALKNLPLEEGFQYAAGQLNLQTSKLLEGVHNGLKMSNAVGEMTKKALDFLTGGNVSKATAWMKKAEDKFLDEERAREKKKQAKILGPTTDTDNDRSLTEEVMNGSSVDDRGTAMNTPSERTINVNQTVSFRASDSIGAEYARLMDKNHLLKQSFTNQESKDSYLYAG
jgi:hypothetical protein